MTQEEIDRYRRTEQARYMRDWRKRNPEKQKAYRARYWEKKAKEAAGNGGANENDRSGI